MRFNYIKGNFVFGWVVGFCEKSEAGLDRGLLKFRAKDCVLDYLSLICRLLIRSGCLKL